MNQMSIVEKLQDYEERLSDIMVAITENKQFNDMLKYIKQKYLEDNVGDFRNCLPDLTCLENNANLYNDLYECRLDIQYMTFLMKW